MIRNYTVFVDDNFHHGDEDERYELGEFNDYESAVTASKKLIDDYLLEVYEKGVKDEDELYQKYITYGEDPFVVPDEANFSGWSYAKQRCFEICGK